MWGTAKPACKSKAKRRFIPTYVGNRLRWADAGDLVTGSSPRMWGTVKLGRRGAASERFIPTYVGNSGVICMASCSLTVHPHVCGEQFPDWNRAISKDGSSPRMWGTDRPAQDQPVPRRFIPTYVGNSAARRLSSRRSSVHPHVCGEQITTPA